MTLVSIPLGGDVGLEAHPETDQLLRLDAGSGRVRMGPAKDKLTFEKNVSNGWCVLVPAGTWHNITNIGTKPMQVYAIYSPAHHKPGKVRATAAAAEADKDAESAAWSVQPKHALESTDDRLFCKYAKHFSYSHDTDMLTGGMAEVFGALCS